MFSPEPILLRDGASVTLRPIRPDDAPRLLTFHTRLSNDTIYRRFLSMHLHLSDEEARHLATVNYETTMALVAVSGDAAGEVIHGVARYVAGADNPTEAEAAIVIEDAYQGQGLGTLLLDRLLAYARAHGITAFVAAINAENDHMLHFVSRSGLRVEKRLQEGVWEMKVYLE